MFTEPEIKSSHNRAYIEYYYNGERQREYNANKLFLSIFPNKAKSLSDKIKLLNKLKFEFQKALEKGWNPLINNRVKPERQQTLEEFFTNNLNNIVNGNYSRTYKQGIEALAKKFLEFVSSSEKKAAHTKFETARLLAFLNLYNSSNRNYMNKRQYLNVLLPGTIQKTPRRKYTETLHQTYNLEDMKKILEFLKDSYPNLYVVALLTYGCFVRPHEEARLLKKQHIREQKIYFSGDENKGKRVRVIYIPDYVYTALLPFINGCNEPNCYLFTGTDKPLNYDYFRTQWTRAKAQLIKLKLIQKNQTLYSFRHTGAVDVFRRTKDVYLLQKLLGHSSIVVTLKYLRGLGEHDMEELRDAAPQL